MRKIYFAGPLFSVAERQYNAAVALILKDAGYDVFLPQTDGYEGANEIGTAEEISKKIFEKDTSAIRNADIIFMVLDGRVPDEGACVELGLATGLNKTCYGIKTDTRSLSDKFDLNPLISGCFKKIFYEERKPVECGGKKKVETTLSAAEVLKKFLSLNEL